jgi:hypothetical protein
MTSAQQASLRRFLAGYSAPLVDLPLVGASAQGLGPAFGSTPAVKLSGGKTGLLILVCEFKPLRPYQPRVTADAVLFNLVADTLLDQQEQWDEHHMGYESHYPGAGPPIFKTFSTPSEAMGALVDALAKKAATDSMWRGIVSREAEDNGVQAEALACFDNVFGIDRNAAETARFVALCERWMQGVQWSKCFYSQRNRPSLGSWEGSPWEPEHVMLRLLPLTPPQMVVEIVPETSEDEQLNRKFGACPWQQSGNFRGVAEESFVLLGADGQIIRQTAKPAAAATPAAATTSSAAADATAAARAAAAAPGAAMAPAAGAAPKKRAAPTASKQGEAAKAKKTKAAVGSGDSSAAFMAAWLKKK